MAFDFLATKEYLSNNNLQINYMDINNLDDSTKKLLANLHEKYPLVPHTGAGRLFSMVRRMKAEKESGIPIGIRSGFAISVETGKAANKMIEREWEKFYKDLSRQLKKDYPDLYDRLFSKDGKSKINK